MGLDVGRLVLLMQIEPGWQVVIRYNNLMLGHYQTPLFLSQLAYSNDNLTLL